MGLVNLVRLGLLWRRGGILCDVVISGFVWARIMCGPDLFLVELDR